MLGSEPRGSPQLQCFWCHSAAGGSLVLRVPRSPVQAAGSDWWPLTSGASAAAREGQWPVPSRSTCPRAAWVLDRGTLGPLSYKKERVVSVRPNRGTFIPKVSTLQTVTGQTMYDPRGDYPRSRHHHESLSLIPSSHVHSLPSPIRSRCPRSPLFHIPQIGASTPSLGKPPPHQ